MEEMNARLHRLERNAMIWRLCTGTIVLVVLLELCGTGQSRVSALAVDNPDQKIDVITAKRLQVVNKKGQVVFSVSTDAAGGGVLELDYANGKKILEARAGDFGLACLAMYSRRGKPTATLRESDHGGGMLKVLSSTMQPVVVVADDENGEGRIVFLSKDGGKKMRQISLQE